MDYMNLGVKSRKTGLTVNKTVQKDEYSMENLNDFFKDEQDS
nr:Chain C, KLLA0B13629p [Kluyveromyces lactis NRRL Y-1140]5T59_F Chain F, KLLA0B13629p [Kluyveromyces lactis NRRL Y-1140]